MYSHCTTGGWIRGNEIDGTQAEYVRIPHADTSLYPIPPGADEEALVMLSDILPTGFECGVLNGKVAPGSTVAIVGAGPIGLAALLTAQFYSPAEIIMIDLDDRRLQAASRFGATQIINSGDGGISGSPASFGASTRPWPPMISLSSEIRTGFKNPNLLMDFPSFLICCGECTFALSARGRNSCGERYSIRRRRDFFDIGCTPVIGPLRWVWIEPK
jgi:hypothetical protein